MTVSPTSSPTTVAIIRLGCARNDVDADELAANLTSGGFKVVDQGEEPGVVLVNTCGFIEAAKTESINEILSWTESSNQHRSPKVVVTGCLAERYGAELEALLPDVAAVIGFDGYHDIADRLTTVLAGGRLASHQPVDRRLLAVTGAGSTDWPKWSPQSRRLLEPGPTASLKIAAGCDRRCAFCAIPSFRGSFRSRPASDIVAEARWLVELGVKELFLVSENSTSYGKDLPGQRLFERLLTQLSAIDGLERIRLSYLQPAELREPLIEAMAATPKVAPYFDLPFQHASAPLLRSMKRFGSADSFLALIEQIRHYLPDAGLRSNFIVGFPGETAADVETLKSFISLAGLDAIGVFPYSDEEGTVGASLPEHLDEAEIAQRSSEVAELADTVTAMRAEDRIGQTVEALVTSVAPHYITAQAGQQGPEDGACELVSSGDWTIGQMVRAQIIGTDGVDWRIESVKPAAVVA
ncbi:MAG: 30S ribosomal protein S12 methylthiotransferase RimO [Propionibacteriaceae bacterium]|jgi:ribosomal protein S12 methylthiotransferase RimO|nr:30S ribosomal protein S12 methylthiotransferase RimO [Propionibacteriaceae bacterium]